MPSRSRGRWFDYSIFCGSYLCHECFDVSMVTHVVMPTNLHYFSPDICKIMHALNTLPVAKHLCGDSETEMSPFCRNCPYCLILLLPVLRTMKMNVLTIQRRLYLNRCLHVIVWCHVPIMFNENANVSFKKRCWIAVAVSGIGKLTHWGSCTCLCGWAGPILGEGLSQAITWVNADKLSIGPPRTSLSQIEWKY